MHMNVIEKVRKRWWDLHRFGLTPDKLAERLVAKPDNRVLAISVPKSGTHLVERILCLCPGYYRRLIRKIHVGNIGEYGDLDVLLPKLGAGQILTAHLYHSEARASAIRTNGVKGLFLYRDPRDVLISSVHYIARLEKHGYHEAMRDCTTLRERLLMRLKGRPEHNMGPLATMLDGHKGWLAEDVLSIRFEDLIGARGGGDNARQREVIARIWNVLGLPPDPMAIERIAERAFSSVSPTFRKGSTGQWRDVFDDEIRDAFKKYAGWTVIDYGYETDDSW
jgi:hypothetical protein